jgi:hypothetical protein
MLLPNHFIEAIRAIFSGGYNEITHSPKVQKEAENSSF